MIRQKLKPSPYYKRLIEKLTKEIQFRKDQNQWDAVEVGNAKLNEVYAYLEDKAEREDKMKHASDPPKYHYIHKVVDLDVLITQLLFLNENCRSNVNMLALKVWKSQNPRLSEHTTGFIDFAEALLEGKYVEFKDIISSKERIQLKKPELLTKN